MSFKNIKSNTQAQKGFTIVELLIVVVVIAILAAITIVSYNGITNRANASSAAALAASVQKKAELYAADDGTSGYPLNLSALSTADTSKTYYLNIPGGAGLTAVDSTSGKKQVQYVSCGVNSSTTTTAPTTQSAMSASTVTGAIINYWDFNNNRITTTSTTPASITLGTISGTSGTKTIGCPTAA